jgi:hypothetical protein
MGRAVAWLVWLVMLVVFVLVLDWCGGCVERGKRWWRR